MHCTKQPPASGPPAEAARVRRSRARIQGALITSALIAGCAGAAPEGPPSGVGSGPAAELMPALDSGAGLAERIDALAQQAIADGKLAGVQVAVKLHGHTVVAKGYGSADLENGLPMRTSSVLKIGSLTKQFTAAAILRLADEGRLALSDLVTDYLPDYPMHGARITIHNLLSHTSGIPEYLDPDSPDLAKEVDAQSCVDLVKNLPLNFQPGESWEYSNTNFVLLGLIIKKVTGQSYEDYVRDHLFPAAGLRQTYYCANESIIPGRARGYDTGRIPETFNNAGNFGMGWAGAAGALCSTTLDLLTWQEALISGAVISPKSRALMITPSVFNDGTTSTYGYGLFVADFEGHKRIFHGGDIPGFSGWLALYPDDGLEIAVLGNVHTSAIPDLGDDIARAALGLPPPVLLDLPVPTNEQVYAVGAYLPLGGTSLAGRRVTVAAEPSGKLKLWYGGKVTELLYQGDHRYVLANFREAGMVLEGGRGQAARLTLTAYGAMWTRCPRIRE